MLDLLRLSMGSIQNGDITKPLRRLAGALSMRFQHSDAAYQSVDMFGNTSAWSNSSLARKTYPAHRRAVGMQVAALSRYYDGQGTKRISGAER